MHTAATKTTSFNVLSIYPKIYEESAKTETREINTKRLYLRAVSCNDFDRFVALFTEPAVMKFIGIEAGYIPSKEEIGQLLDGAIQAWETRGYGRWSLFDQKTSEFIGFCGFRSEQGMPELICMLHERFWGKGLAVEAARACLNYGFESIEFTEVKAFTRPGHKRARQVMNKLDAEFINYVDFHGVQGAAYLIKPDSIEF